MRESSLFSIVKLFFLPTECLTANYSRMKKGLLIVLFLFSCAYGMILKTKEGKIRLNNLHALTDAENNVTVKMPVDPENDTEPARRKMPVDPENDTEPAQSKMPVDPKNDTEPAWRKMPVDPENDTEPAWRKMPVDPENDTEPARRKMPVDPENDTEPAQRSDQFLNYTRNNDSFLLNQRVFLSI
ncbi:104 kDa microneme/rhoptry antigen isoform X2 [Anguilla rostrata]|uniref:104 kDa microneme/rhoptry antigen isoform X2 n=1 Tax=Anguilla rostrata TaxID=7938 RepID=UPI0030CC3A3F